MAKETPISTILRNALPDGVWDRGYSKVYKDLSYTKTRVKTTWKIKYIGGKEWNKTTQAKWIKDVSELLGPRYTVNVFGDEPIVFVYDDIVITVK